MREQTVERIKFNKEIRKKVLLKSKGRCAHCGKPLTEKLSTIDHIIPISKGGTNDYNNLAALCDSCNSDKGDEIVAPVAYFKYLEEEHIREVKRNHDEYCEDVSWLTTKNYMREDRVEMRYMGFSKVLKGRRVRKGNNVYAHCIQNSAILYKARYEDLDEVAEYINKYHKKFNLDTSYIEKSISDTYKKGCIYVLKRGIEIIAVFPATIDKHPVTKDGQESYIMSFSGIPVLYQRSEYIQLVKDCIARINAGVVMANGKNIALYEVYYPVADTYLRNIIRDNSYYGYTKEYEFKDGWGSMILCQRWETFKGQLEGQDFDPEEDVRYYSQALERIMDLKSTKAKEDKADIQDLKKKIVKSSRSNSGLNKERRRASRAMIDEYDERYYM